MAGFLSECQVLFVRMTGFLSEWQGFLSECQVFVRMAGFLSECHGVFVGMSGFLSECMLSCQNIFLYVNSWRHNRISITNELHTILTLEISVLNSTIVIVKLWAEQIFEKIFRTQSFSLNFGKSTTKNVSAG